MPLRTLRSGPTRYVKRRNYLIANGQPLKVPAKRARAHLEALRAGGVTWTQLVSDSGLKIDTIIAVHRGARDTIWRTTETRILAAHPQPSPEALVSALGSTRRLRALMTDGHRMTEVAAYGLSVDTLAQIVGGKATTVRLWVAQTVARAYTELAPQPGTYERNRRRGIAARWPGSNAWHPDDLDLPDPQPATPRDAVDLIAVGRALEGHRVPLTKAEQLRVTQVLTERGETEKNIADLVGRSDRTIGRWRRAHGWKAAA